VGNGLIRNVSPIGAIAHDDFVIDDDGVELRTISTDPGTIETYVYRKQFRERSLGVLENLTVWLSSGFREHIRETLSVSS
jgi:hypothetical protein